MIIDGVLGSEAIDSSGEILDVEGADISDVDKGTLLLNWEHAPGEDGASTLVGKVVAAKKIYNKDDCENDRQRGYWDQVKLPFIYGVCRLYDGAGHEEAKRIAAIVRDHVANKEMVVCRFSVEGSTLEKEGNRLKASVIRRVAVTVKPCNRTAQSGLIEDPNAPAGFEKVVAKEKVKDLLDLDFAHKGEDPVFARLGGSFEVTCNPLVEEASLEKALEAGSYAGAPGSLTGGAALQREDAGLRKRAVKALQEYGQKAVFDKAEFRAFMKQQLPDASDEFLDHFEGIGEDYHVKRTHLKKKESTRAAKLTPVVAKPKVAPKKSTIPTGKAPAGDEGESVVQIKQGTIRGVPVMPNAAKGHSFDETNGILHTPKGSFPLYNPDKGFQTVEHKSAKKGAFYKDAKLFVAPGTDMSKVPANPANPGFREVYNSKPIEDFHSGKVMPNWLRVHELNGAGKLPEEIAMHAAVFSMLSPNTPVRPHELMHSHMVDTWEDLGIDPRDPDFVKARSHWLGKDKAQNYPRNAGDYFRNHPDIHLQNASEEKGRKVGDLKSFMLGPNKFKNIAQYSKLHPTLLSLIAKHGNDSRAAAADLMKLKVEENQWKAKRQLFKTKVKQKAATELGLGDHASGYVKQKVEEAKANGLMGRRKDREPGDDDDEQAPWDPRMLPDHGEPLGDMSVYYGSPTRAQTKGDTAKRLAFQQEAEALGLHDDLSEYSSGEVKKQFGKYPGVPVPGLAPKTGRFTFTMLGGGNSFVPDTHMVRHMFGMDSDKDGPTLAYIKQNVLWNPKNHHILEAMDRWYAKNHPAAQLMQQHPLWGRHFKDDPEQANFPGFWRHWCSIAEDERRRGITDGSSRNEFSTHEPFWTGIEKYLNKHEGGTMAHDAMGRLLALHLQYREHNGEVPAQMMYFSHIVPHLIEANQFRTKHDDMADFVKSAKVYGLNIELRKATDDVQVARLADPNVPTVHGVHVKIGDNEHRAGRFALAGGRIHHLEDYHGLLERLLPEGPLTVKGVSRIHALKMSPYIRIDTEEMPPEKYNEAAAPELAQPPKSTIKPASVFEYQRAGMDKPHTLEVKNGQYMLDGNRLTHPEVQTILENHNTGAAEIRYKKPSASVERIQKMEMLFDDLLKAAGDPEIDDDALLQHARAAEDAGHLPKGYSQSMTRHMYEDPMTPGMGNKKAWQNFAAKMKPGAYIQMDGNDFKSVNDAFGHQGGDSAIKAFGTAARTAMDETVGSTHGKLFRNGGDEFVAHVPSHEHAAAFARNLSQKLNDMAPIEGRHKLSMSFGFGHTPEVADKALYHAKNQKINPETGQRAYPVGKVPNLAHSLVPGHEGAIPVHQPEIAVHQKVMASQPVLPTPSAAQVPADPDPAKARVQTAA